MPTKITNAIVDISLDGKLMKGILNGDESNWSFQSLSQSFLAFFPDGLLCSYTYLGTSSNYYEHHKLKLEVATKLSHLLAAKRARQAASFYNAAPTAPAQRRYVIPR